LKLKNPLILAVYVPSALLSVCQGMMVPVLPIFTRTFDASYGVVGLVLATEGVGQICGNVPVGTLIRRVGRNNTMRLGVGLVVLTVLALYWTNTVYEVIGLRFLTGFGHAVWNVSRLSYLAEATVSHRRGRAIAIFGGVGRMGGFIGPAVGGAIAMYAGLRAPFLVYAIVGVGVILLILFGLDPDKRSTEPENRKTFRLWEVFKAQRAVLASAGTAQTLVQMVRSGRSVIVPLYAADVIGLEVGAIGLVLSAASFVDMSLFYPAGMIMDRFGRKFAIVPSFALQAVGMACIPFTGGFATLTAATCIIGIGNGLSSGSMMTLGADLAPAEDVGDFLGVWRLIGDGGSMGSPLIVGGISDIVGLQPAALVIACTGLAGSAMFALLVPETLEKAGEAQHTPP
tara:strand:- start:1697 stop:2893 length:1197 start_codon:yes stop_codon:yes gene_type:complete